MNIASRECIIIGEESPKALLIQPLYVDERLKISDEAALIRQMTGVPTVMCGVVINDWEGELAPWADPLLDYSPHAGMHSWETLRYVTDELTPYLTAEYGPLPVILGGYSLGGLFSLWAATVSCAFSGIAAASPSAWIEGWQRYSAQHELMTDCLYLSLGKREERVRNQKMAIVGDAIRSEFELRKRQLGPQNVILEWNEGGHFNDTTRRTARAFAWCVSRISGSEFRG